MEKLYFNIYVNGQKKHCVWPTMSYEQIVTFAYGLVKSELVYNYTVTYTHGQDGRSGEMLRGEKVNTIENMVFNVIMTDKS
jgi:hypothetical protein